MNLVFFLLVLAGFLATAWQQLTWVPPLAGAAVAPMTALTQGMIEAARGAVTLSLELVGVMALFLGLMKVAEAGGMLTILARLARPLMIRLFPEVPAEHPAMGAMILNLTASALGLGNAATPFGLRAMDELARLNPHGETASNPMALFLAINTASITLIPTSVIALRAAAGSAQPAAILPSTLFASLAATLVAIVAARLLQPLFPLPPAPSPPEEKAEDDPAWQAVRIPYPAWLSGLVGVLLVALIPLTLVHGRELTPWLVPGLMAGMLGFGVMRGVAVYETFVAGAREGFDIAVRIIPYLVAILVAIAMFRQGGGLDLVISLLAPLTTPLGLPAEALPMALLRPLSGSGALGVMTAILKDPAIGPDSYVGLLVSTLQGSSETTFYVLAVYYGGIGVRRIRHTLAAALLADLAAVIFAVIACRFLVEQG